MEARDVLLPPCCTSLGTLWTYTICYFSCHVEADPELGRGSQLDDLLG